MHAFALPIALGAALWATTAAMSYPRELWDVSAFWVVWGFATVLSGAMGYAYPHRAWLPPVLVFASLPVVLAATGLAAGRGASLWVPGLVLVALIALPALALSHLAARLNTRR